ncbi:M14 family metallopeptidase [Reyranella sp.]|uniref:M14 family metallopeptidase n=1 Tax=Reyranella sp. TaxID=1929291 RepID=UPI003BABBE85
MVMVPACFSESYAEARPKFCEAAAAAGGVLGSWFNPNGRGPGGERLFLDTARFGPMDAEKMLVLIAGTHGVEGHCGSGAEIAWLRDGGPAKLPADTGALLIHALNPHGFAWTRRVTEDNVDLNRNFVDHDKAYPANDGYRALADAILPAAWDEASRTETERVFQAFTQKHGAFGLQGAISGGQYSHPDGIFFGGRKPTWSNRTVRAIARQDLSRARHVAVIDFHTGLGPFGHGELICAVPPGARSFDRARAWYGDEMTSPEGGTSTSAIVVGIMTDAFSQELPDAEVTPIAIEYGTYSVPEVLNAVRADNWLHQRGDLGSALGRALKADMKERFFPAGDKWREMVWARAEQTIGWAVKGLAAG